MNSEIQPATHSACNGCPNEAGAEMSRRGFLGLLAAGAGVVLLNGCGQSDDIPSGAPPTPAAPLVEAIAVGQEWKVPGAGALKNGEGMGYAINGKATGIVFKTADGQLKALSARCTHAGGTVEWQNGQLHCPTHGSNFDTNGKVTHGPATKPLPAIKVRAQGADVLVTAA
jgi:cytochrome b6-f complex iron-sulfur subunit